MHSSFRPGVGVLCLLKRYQFESWSLAALASPSVAKRTADQGLAARWLPVQLVEPSDERGLTTFIATASS